MPVMLTARPVSVQIIASETPVAIERASADPSAAMESNTVNMPTTVPMSPSSGHIGTSTRRICRFRVSPAFRRLIIAPRMARAAQLLRSARWRHAFSWRAASTGWTRAKYQKRSSTMVHMSTQATKIHTTTGPPRRRMFTTASIGTSMKSGMGRRLLFLEQLQSFGQEARALLVEHLHDRLGDRREPGVEEQQRDGDTEAEHRRDHRLRDTRGHELGIAGPGLGDALEGEDHADDGADEA